MDAKTTILEARFLISVRDGPPDRSAYFELIRALEALAREWKAQSLVEKAVAFELAILAGVVRGAASRRPPEEAAELDSMAEELEALAVACFE